MCRVNYIIFYVESRLEKLTLFFLFNFHRVHGLLKLKIKINYNIIVENQCEKTKKKSNLFYYYYIEFYINVYPIFAYLHCIQRAHFVSFFSLICFLSTLFERINYGFQQTSVPLFRYRTAIRQKGTYTIVKP